MVRFSNIVLTYLVIGGVMFGGGAVDWGNIGAAKYFVDGQPGDLSPGDDTTEKLTGVSGAIKSIVDQFAGPLVIVWNLLVGLITYMNWPVVVMMSNNVPPSLTILLGIPLTAAFYLSLIRVVRTSA